MQKAQEFVSYNIVDFGKHVFQKTRCKRVENHMLDSFGLANFGSDLASGMQVGPLSVSGVKGISQASEPSSWPGMPPSSAKVETAWSGESFIEGVAKQLELGNWAFVNGLFESIEVCRSKAIVVGKAFELKVRTETQAIVVGDVHYLRIGSDEKTYARKIFSPPLEENKDLARVWVFGNVEHLETSPLSKVVVVGKVSKWSNNGSAIVRSTQSLPSTRTLFRATSAAQLLAKFPPKVVACGSLVLGYFASGDHGFDSCGESLRRVAFASNGAFRLMPVSVHELSEMCTTLLAQVSAAVAAGNLHVMRRWAGYLVDFASVIYMAGARASGLATSLLYDCWSTIETALPESDRDGWLARINIALCDCLSKAGMFAGGFVAARTAASLVSQAKQISFLEPMTKSTLGEK